MNNYYFTFGIGSPLHGFYQPVVAENTEQAMEKMFEEWGNKWAFCYSQDQWVEGDMAQFNYKPLETIYAYSDISCGAMLILTERLNGILAGPKSQRDGRLAQMMTDLEQVYKIPFLTNDEWNKRNPFVLQMYRAVSEARAL